LQSRLKRDEKYEAQTYVNVRIGLRNSIRRVKIPTSRRPCAFPRSWRSPDLLLTSGSATDTEEKGVYEFLEKNKEPLAEAEHDGWADQRRLEGWTYAPPRRDNIKRTHPLLVPYDDLPGGAEEQGPADHSELPQIRTRGRLQDRLWTERWPRRNVDAALCWRPA
jgi:hypothetical protein